MFYSNIHIALPCCEALVLQINSMILIRTHKNNKGPNENLLQFISLLGLLYIIMHVYQYHDKNRDLQQIISKYFIKNENLAASV